jgi:superfamily II DNA/RNA helicase
LQNDFEAMGLRDSVLRGVYAFGYERPSQIQAKAIPVARTGRDTIIQAQSGTGKTAAFAISVLDQLDLDCRSVQTMVLSPTRELAVQTASVFGEKIVASTYTHTHTHTYTEQTLTSSLFPFSQQTAWATTWECGRTRWWAGARCARTRTS